MDVRPTMSFSDPLSLREFEAEIWKLYLGFVKGLLVAFTSVIHLFVLTLFFVLQYAVLVASKASGSIIDWSPEKPHVFGMGSASGE